MTENTTFTVQIPIRKPSQRKQQRLEECMEKQQEIAHRCSELMPTISQDRWGNTRRDSVFHRWIEKEFPDKNGLRSHDANQAVYKVSENFATWKSNGYPGERPQYKKETSWIRFCNCSDSLKYEKNDGSWGVKIPLEPYNPEWFRLRTGGYQEKFLERSFEDDVKFGDAELKKHGESYTLNQTVTLPDTRETDYEPETFIGVDLNLGNIAAVAVQRQGETKEVELFSGDEVAHHRQRLRETRSELQEAGKQDKVEELKGLEQRFCQHENHRVSKRIVEIAEQYENPVIIMENLKGIRERINEKQRSNELTTALNSWSFHELQSMIEYKAAKANIKTQKASPSYTSQNCNKCNERGVRPYEGNWSRFYCRDCDYEVNADANAAMNISKRSVA